MDLVPTLNSVRDLLKKLEREAYRAYHSKHPVSMYDHFFNFCITAHSMRDYFFEEGNIRDRASKQQYHDEWNNDQFLIACREIANSTKHLVLRDREGEPDTYRTKEVYSGESDTVLLKSENGELKKHYTVRNDVFVVLAEKQKVTLYEFSTHVEHYWYRFLERYSMIKNDPELLCRLGSMYGNGGDDFPVDHEKGNEYLILAAKFGSRDAIAELGSKFMLGQGFKHSKTLALVMYRLANLDRYRSIKKDLIKKMSQAEIDDADDQLRSWNSQSWNRLKRSC